MDEKFPERIWCAQKGEYGRGLDAGELRTWSERREYHEVFGEVEYVRADCIPDPAATMKEVVEVLIDLETYFDQRSDVVDGDYGVPEPNAEMQHLTAVQSVLAKLGRE